MNAVVQEKLTAVRRICAKHRVRTLAIFGSAASGDCESAATDLDFVVEFQSMGPTEHANGYFGLLEDLEVLFQLPIDLVELRAIDNPYFLESLAETQVLLYEAS